MNRLDSAYHQPSTSTSSEPAALLQSPLLNAAILVVLCITGITFFELWPDTIKRFLWESLVRMIPSRLIAVIHRRFVKDRNGPGFGADSEGNLQAKSAALERIFGFDGTPLLHRTQTLTGLPLESKSNKPAGLGNWDNSCYQNSMIQGLSSLSAFRRFLAHHLEVDSGTDLPTHAALDRIIQRLSDAKNNGRTLWTPPALKSMSSWQQQDAQEYFSKIALELENECSKWMKRHRIIPGLSKNAGFIKHGKTDLEKETPQPMETSVANPLEGLLAQRVGCMKCGYAEGLSVIPFNCLTVTLGTNRWEYDVRDCLDEYTALEQIPEVECAKCTLLQKRSQVERLLIESEAGVHGDPNLFKTLAGARLAQIDKALSTEDFSESTLTKQCHIPAKDRISTTKSKQAVICRPPECLVIHVNRSAFDEMTSAQYKNHRAVRFPLQLDVNDWTLGTGLLNSDLETWVMDPAKSMLGNVKSKGSKAWRCYELRAVVTHYGRHENGHYIAYKKVTDPRSSINGTECSTAESLSSERWFELSDADVTEISEETLLCQGGVFMLFYEALSPHFESEKAPLATEMDGASLFKAESLDTGNLEDLAYGIGVEEACRIPLPLTPPLEEFSTAAPFDIQGKFPTQQEASNSSTAIGTDLLPPSAPHLPMSPEPSETDTSECEGQEENLAHQNSPLTNAPSPSSTRFIMRTATDQRGFARSHDGHSQDNCTLPASPSVVSAI